jgi:hypothetical protein
MLEAVLEDPLIDVASLRDKNALAFHLPFPEVALVEITVRELLLAYPVVLGCVRLDPRRPILKLALYQLLAGLYGSKSLPHLLLRCQMVFFLSFFGSWLRR